MYGPTLATYSHSFAIDRVLANLLTNSHATVYPLFCDGTQKNECSIYGGIWNEFSSFKEACNNFQSRYKELWYAHDEPVLNMSLFQKNEDEIEI
jgi:cytochrome c556